MITLILGKPGAGKSHEAVESYVLPNIKKGRKIITNLPLNLEYIYSIFPEAKENDLIDIRMGANGTPYDAFSNANDFVDEWRDPKTGQGAFFIVDEAHFCLDSSLGVKKLKPVEDWFSLHRQHGADVVLITQTAKKITKRVLDMVELYIKLRKAGLFGGITSIFTKGGSENMYLKHYFSSLEKSEKPTKSERKTYKKSVHNCYKSHLMTNVVVQESNEFKVGKTALIKNTWYIWVILIMILYVVYKIFFSGESINPLEKKQPIEKSISQPVKKHTPSKSPKVKKGLVEKPLKKVKSVKGVKPLDNFNLSIQSSHYENNNIIFNLLVEDNNQELFNINSFQLKDMGYSVLTFGKGFDKNSCAIILKYKEETQYVFCKSEDKKSSSSLPSFGMSNSSGNENVN